MPSEQTYSSSHDFQQNSRATTPIPNYRPSSALEPDSSSSARWEHRPKSTPAWSSHRQNLAQQSSKLSRPKSVAVVLQRTECERVHQLEHEPTRRHILENHLPLKRAKPPPWRRNMESPLVPFQVRPGYVLSRSKSRYHATIRDQFFQPVQNDSSRFKHRSPLPGHDHNGGKASQVRHNSDLRFDSGVDYKRQFSEVRQQKSQSGSERASLLTQLQEQISDLMLYLEEERLSHKQTKQKAEEFLRDKLDQMNSHHQEQLRMLEANHKEEMLKEKQEMSAKHKDIQDTMEKQISRMAKEIELLQAAFESYKSTLHEETAEKWNMEEEKLKLKCAEDKEQAFQEMKSKFIQERNQERNNTAKDHQKALETLRKENKREMNSLIRRFSNTAADNERLKQTAAELEETKAELEHMKESYNTACQQLASTTRQLTDTKIRLMEFEEQFHEKVSQVDDKYRHELQELMIQNTELKRLLVQKCGELFSQKENLDYQSSQRVKSARETMETLIKSKQRANVSIAVGSPVVKARGMKTRPLSAPGTHNETKTAHKMAGKVEIQEKEQEFIAPEIYLNSKPEIDEMRAELLSSEQGREHSKAELLKSLKNL